MTTDYSEFSSYYKPIVDQQDKILPFYGQEFVIRDAYSSFIASKDYNIFMSALHKHFISKNKEDFFARSLFQEMQKANLNYIDLHTPLFKARDAGESLYWKTDSHWNEKAVEISVEALEKVVQKYFTPE